MGSEGVGHSEINPWAPPNPEPSSLGLACSVKCASGSLSLSGSDQFGEGQEARVMFISVSPGAGLQFCSQ